jgi:hypothetical protein
VQPAGQLRSIGFALARGQDGVAGSIGVILASAVTATIRGARGALTAEILTRPRPNRPLREALELAAHRVALREWLDELDEKHGTSSAEQLTAALALLDAIKHGEVDGTNAA